MKPSKKDYNFMALQGIQISDEEYVDEFGVPPEYAYTPELNYWLINRVYEQNIKYFEEEEDMSHGEAVKKAGDIKEQKIKEVKELMAQKGLL